TAGDAGAARRPRHGRQARLVDPAVEIGLEVLPAPGPERPAQVLRARLRTAVPLEERARPREERLVADQAAQHVQHPRALVVDDRPEEARLLLQMDEALAEHGT